MLPRWVLLCEIITAAKITTITPRVGGMVTGAELSFCTVCKKLTDPAPEDCGAYVIMVPTIMVPTL